MIIRASVRSSAFKRGAEKRIAKALKIEPDLRDMVGRLHLDAQSTADIGILTMLRKHVFGRMAEDEDKTGTVRVFDAAGAEVCSYRLGGRKGEESANG